VDRSHTRASLPYKLPEIHRGAVQLRCPRAQAQCEFTEIPPERHANHLQPTLFTFHLKARDALHHNPPLHQRTGRQLWKQRPHCVDLPPRGLRRNERKLRRKARRTREGE